MIVKQTDPQVAIPVIEPGEGSAFSVSAWAFSANGCRKWLQAGHCPAATKVAFASGRLHVEDLANGVRISIPPSALTPTGFARWSFSDDYPEFGKVEYVAGELFITMSPEALNTHAKVKLEITRVISNLVIEHDWGQVYPDRTKVVSTRGELSNEPDACFCRWESFRQQRVREVCNRHGEAQWLEGAVDWVLEIVSDSSVRKDTQVLRAAYFLAGVQEYWLIDARAQQLDFRLFTRGKNQFRRQPNRGGWVASPLFERKFSLQRRDYGDYWRYDLAVAPLRKVR